MTNSHLLRLLLCLCGGNFLQNEEGCDHQHDADGQADPGVLDKAGEDVAHEADCSHGEEVGGQAGLGRQTK